LYSIEDRALVELLWSAVWTLWLKRNNIIFKNEKKISLFKTLGIKIINLDSFWCKALKNLFISN
jgi:hypothetical protein